MKTQYLGELARINKTAFRALTSINSEYIEKYTTVVQFNDEVCAGCPFYAQIKALENEKERLIFNAGKTQNISDIDSTLTQIHEACVKTCSKACIKKVYNNDNNTYHLYKRPYQGKRLPKTAMKLYLLIHLLPKRGGKDYARKFVSSKMLAECIGCNIKTVEKSLRILDGLEYTMSCRANGNHSFNIIINGEKEQHLSASEGGSGYITLPKEIIMRLIGEKDVNVLRLELYKLLRADDKVHEEEQCPVTEISLRDVKLHLPSHIGFGDKFKKLLSKCDEVFEQKIENNRLYVKTKGFFLKGQEQIIKKRNLDLIKQLVVQNELHLNEEILEDILSVSIQYASSIISRAIKIYREKCRYEIVQNIGAYIRNTCYHIVISEMAA